MKRTLLVYMVGDIETELAAAKLFYVTEGMRATSRAALFGLVELTAQEQAIEVVRNGAPGFGVPAARGFDAGLR